MTASRNLGNGRSTSAHRFADEGSIPSSSTLLARALGSGQSSFSEARRLPSAPHPRAQQPLWRYTVAGSEAPYTAQDLDASDPDDITWKVEVEVDLENFGLADSSSTFDATRRD